MQIQKRSINECKKRFDHVKVLLIRVQVSFEILSSQDFVHTRLKSCNYISRIQWLIGGHGINENSLAYWTVFETYLVPTPEVLVHTERRHCLKPEGITPDKQGKNTKTANFILPVELYVLQKCAAYNSLTEAAWLSFILVLIHAKTREAYRKIT